MRFFLLPILVVVLCSACKKEPVDEMSNEAQNDRLTKVYPSVEKALWPYFEEFEKEAAVRGIAIDLSDGEIHGVIQEITQEHIAGTCNYNSHRTDLVTIDKEFWDSSPDLLREAVVFHELGHCRLVRDHREGSDDNGNCISLMASGTESCRQFYSAAIRTALLDELFDPTFQGDWFD